MVPSGTVVSRPLMVRLGMHRPPFSRLHGRFECSPRTRPEISRCKTGQARRPASAKTQIVLPSMSPAMASNWSRSWRVPPAFHNTADNPDGPTPYPHGRASIVRTTRRRKTGPRSRVPRPCRCSRPSRSLPPIRPCCRPPSGSQSPWPTSISSAVRILAEMPPGMTALSLLPSRTPPAFSISSLRVMPTGSS